MITTLITTNEYKDLGGNEALARQNAVAIPGFGTDTLYVVDTALAQQLGDLGDKVNAYEPILLAYCKANPVANGTTITLELVEEAVKWTLEQLNG